MRDSLMERHRTITNTVTDAYEFNVVL